VLTVAGDSLKELVVGVITDTCTGKGGSTVATITQSAKINISEKVPSSPLLSHLK